MAINKENYNTKMYDVFDFNDFISEKEIQELQRDTNRAKNGIENKIRTVRYNYNYYGASGDEHEEIGDLDLVNMDTQEFSFQKLMRKILKKNPTGGQVITSIQLDDNLLDFEEKLLKLSNEISHHYANKKTYYESQNNLVIHAYGSWLSGHRDSCDIIRENVVLLYLSDNDVKGGELVVGNGEDKTIIKPTFGTGVVINLSFEDESKSPYHEVLPTTQGYRLSTTTFYNSKPVGHCHNNE